MIGSTVISQDFFLPGGGRSLRQRLQQLHLRLLETAPCVDAIACAVYEAKEDLLKTFVSSTRQGRPLAGHQIRLSHSPSLSQLARTGRCRVIDDIPAAVRSTSRHSAWLLSQGYRSSFTVPLYDHGAFIGMLFFDSQQLAAFNASVQRDLALYSTLVNLALANEQAAVRSLLAATRMAREFAHMRDFETGAHLDRMAHLSRLIARAVAPRHGLDDEFIERVFLYAPLHDIGKIGIADELLLKPGQLEPHERLAMQAHVAKGTEVIDKIIGHFALQQLTDSDIMRNIVRCHHEFLDGSGYPEGLRGAQIPLEARIVTVADILDALANARPYKPAWPLAQATAELDRMAAAGRLDADCVAALRTHAAEVADILGRYQDPVLPA